jgi:maleylacetate reductase
VQPRADRHVRVLAEAPQRVLFGAGAISNIPDEVSRLGLRRVLVISTPGHAMWGQDVATALGDRSAALFSGARMHTPTTVTDEVRTVVADRSIDGVVAVGGGSAIGLSKAIAFRTDLPQIVAPTTYAGSEATPLLGETRDGDKRTVRDRRILPEVIVYDVALTMSLTPRQSVASGMNALAHAVEALYAKEVPPLVVLIAEEGIYKVGRSLPILAEAPEEDEARTDALYGAWLCGRVLAGASMALHHRLCHVLGGAFDLPHADTHAILLPHVARFNRSDAPDALARAARALEAKDAASALFDLGSLAGMPVALRDIGMPEAGLDRAADLITENPPSNPRAIVRDDVRALLDRAWRGARK